MQLRVLFPIMLFLCSPMLFSGCHTDTGGAGTPPPDTATVDNTDSVVLADTCENSSSGCPDEDVEEIEDIREEIAEKDEGSSKLPEPTEHDNPDCRLKNIVSLSGLGDAEDRDPFKILAQAVPGEFKACIGSCDAWEDCPNATCTPECCDSCWRELTLDEISDENPAPIVPEVDTNLNNLDNWKCDPKGCGDLWHCRPLDTNAKYIVWGEVISKGKTLLVQDFCLETSPESVVGQYKGKFSYLLNKEIKLSDGTIKIEGKKGSQEIQMNVASAGGNLKATVVEDGTRKDVFINGVSDTPVTQMDGMISLTLTWCLSMEQGEDEECGNSTVVLHSRRNTLSGDLDDAGTNTSKGELETLTLSLDRDF